jgi:hypothetical protein
VNRPAVRQEAESTQTANATSNSAAATGSGTAINAQGAGQVIVGIEAGRDVIINPPSAMMKQQDGRELVDLMPDDLTRFFRGDQTTIQSNKMVESFIGKWMRVKGELADVTLVPGFGVQVTFSQTAGLNKAVIMNFVDKKWVGRLYGLLKGTRI